MPTTMHDREQGFEAKFAHDEELRFLFGARRDKLFARWAATRLGLSDEAREGLVTAVLAIPGGPGHDQAVLKHVADRLSAHGAGASATELTAALDQCAQQARAQLLEAEAGGPG